MLGEALGAIAPLQQKALPHRNLGQGALELARLARNDKGRKTGELMLDIAERGEIGHVRAGHRIARGKRQGGQHGGGVKRKRLAAKFGHQLGAAEARGLAAG